MSLRGHAFVLYGRGNLGVNFPSRVLRRVFLFRTSVMNPFKLFPKSKSKNEHHVVMFSDRSKPKPRDEGVTGGNRTYGFGRQECTS